MTDEEEDVNYCKFGKNSGQIEFIANATVNLLLKQTKAADESRRYPEAFEQSAKYCDRFGGALQSSGPLAIDELTEGLNALEFIRTVEEDEESGSGGGAGYDAEGAGGGGGGVITETRIKLESYEVVALINLNPNTPAAAKSLIPSLDKVTDEELENEVLKLLRRASARYTGLGVNE